MNFLKSENPIFNTYDFILHNLSDIMEHYQALIENTSENMYLIFSKPTCQILYASPSISLLTGYCPDDFYASPELFKSLLHPEDLPKVEATLKSVFTDCAAQKISFRLCKIDKTFIEVELKIISITKNNNHSSSFCAIIRKTAPPLHDISYLERLNTIGKMASSVAHEIRNPMTTVRGYLQFFSTKEEFAKYKEHFDLLISELDRTNLIIKEYLSLNQNKLSKPDLCQLNDIIISLYPLLKADANNVSKDIRINLEEIPQLYLNEKEIRQLILNMVRNSLEAMVNLKDRTTVSIQTSLEDNHVLLSVKDQGGGIAPNILANIGEAYLTTKEHGTGLGLMVCYRIAANHRAQIKVDTSPLGTSFLVKIPLS